MIILTYGETSTTPLLSAKPANLVPKVSKNKLKCTCLIYIQSTIRHDFVMRK